MERRNKNKKTKNFLYYGVYLNTETQKKLLSMLQNSLDVIFTSYKEDFGPTYETLTLLIKQFDNYSKESKGDSIKEINSMKYPKHFHITIAFGGRKGFNKNSLAVKQFSQGKDVKLYPSGFFILPGKIVVSLAFTDCEIENKFPHITTFLGEYRPVQSNDVLEELLGENMPLEKEFEKLKEGGYKESFYVNKLKAKILKEEQDVYVFLTNKNEELEGMMKGYYD